jgi:hypothetical protein
MRRADQRPGYQASQITSAPGKGAAETQFRGYPLPEVPRSRRRQRARDKIPTVSIADMGSPNRGTAVSQGNDGRYEGIGTGSTGSPIVRELEVNHRSAERTGK